ncbi:MAG TPA: type II secretion system protein [Candidatus Saccharimonadales bacterium]|nr:type II secretion system protein [Candidatus Saccharimonadales bacterium]
MAKRGFTLIELLIVISIIGILMLVGSYAYGIISARSRDNSRKADLARVQNALQLHYLDLRLYPTFDTTGVGGKGGAPIYSAAWQLSSGTGCAHATSDALASKYISKIPEDPTQSTNFTTQNCGSLTASQSRRYLYITNTDANGPAANPTLFGLLAKLESPAASDVLAAGNNPLLSGNTSTQFGPWYAGFDNYGTTIGVDANYMITGSVGR